MKKIIFITIYLISQTLFSQNIENNCFKCKYEFKEFYYVNFVYQYNYGNSKGKYTAQKYFTGIKCKEF